MPAENSKDGLLRSLERIRVTASKVEHQLTELHNIVRFDHRSTGARERTERLEAELTHMAEAVRQFREHVVNEQSTGQPPPETR